jgi:hypothetical protein
LAFTGVFSKVNSKNGKNGFENINYGFVRIFYILFLQKRLHPLVSLKSMTLTPNIYVGPVFHRVTGSDHRISSLRGSLSTWI